MATENKAAAVSVRITPTTARIWQELADHWGQSKTAVLERLLRDTARAEGIGGGAASTSTGAARTSDTESVLPTGAASEAIG